MKRGVTESESRRILNSTEDVPPCFHHDKVKKKAQEYDRTVQLKVTRIASMLSPTMEVVLKMVPAIWVSARHTCHNVRSVNMSNGCFGQNAVLDQVSSPCETSGQVTFFNSTRDSLVQNIKEALIQRYTENLHVLRMNLNNGEEQDHRS